MLQFVLYCHRRTIENTLQQINNLKLGRFFNNLFVYSGYARLARKVMAREWVGFFSSHEFFASIGCAGYFGGGQVFYTNISFSFVG